jgi:hypothetical protein
MTQRESKLSAKIQKELRRAHGPELFVFKVWGNERMWAGLPDLVGCYRGMFFAFEVKLPEYRSNVSPIQQHVHELLRGAGAQVQVVCSVREAEAALQLMATRRSC